MSYLERLAQDIQAEIPAAYVPSGETEMLFLLYALLLLAKGESVTREDVHNAWAAWKLLQGQDQDHEAVVPYDQLSREKQEEDSPYMFAIRRVASRRKRSSYS